MARVLSLPAAYAAGWCLAQIDRHVRCGWVLIVWKSGRLHLEINS